ncbi:MAG: ABC transporter permease [Flavobacteriaceae bacterium]|nr:ABC transporter permease [Flavobacteriaceae bacterium]
MLRLLSIELHKLKYNKSAKVISIVYFILISFIALIASIEFNFGSFHFRIADQGIFNFPFIWHFNTWVAAILKLFLAIVIVSMMANEYSNRTLKQNLIDGLSKKEFVLSKFLTVVLFAMVSTLFVFIVSLILGLIFSDYNEIGIIFSDTEYLLAYFVNLIGFFSFCLFLGILVKRSAFALGFLLIWSIMEGIIYSFLKWEMFRNSNLADNIIQLFPLASMSNLIKEPFSRLGAVQSAANQLG